MKKSKITTLLIAIAAFALANACFTAGGAERAYAAQRDLVATATADDEAPGEAETGASGEVDHDLVVLEEGEVPLAASASISGSEEGRMRPGMVIWVVTLVFLSVCLAGYFAYFSGYRKRVAEIRRKIPREERAPACAPTIVFHPNRWKDIADDYENELASKYLDND
ncbi:MAG: hypothetical protein IJT16_10045 [Lachnospiraceae bacterium]|nr:hypothetical protein [Lachnospiraceae bacterium]